MDRTPLGGGAMVGLQLARHWASREDFRLTVLGSGPVSPGPDVEYIRIPTNAPASLIGLSEFGYARFCREFEHATTAYLAAYREAFPPGKTAVILNDISEGPDAERLAQMGYPVMSIWHVDVVDFFNKMYLRNLVRPDRLTRAFDRWGGAGLSWTVPDVLKLVFEKQRRAVAHSAKLVMPSKQMAQTLRRCYRHLPPYDYPGKPSRPLEDRIMVLPWGGWNEDVPPDVLQEDMRQLRAQYQIRPGTRVLITISRISPEKGIHLLLEALRLLETGPDRPAKDVCLLICGEPAFMRGKSYNRQVRAAARRLKHCRVFFPGYLSPRQKQAHLGISNLFVSASIHESYGLSIVEALRGGVPVLASDHSGVDEILSPEFSRIVEYNGQAGAWINLWGPRGKVPRRLASALRDLLRDPGKLKEMGSLARKASVNMSFAAASQRLASAALELIPS